MQKKEMEDMYMDWLWMVCFHHPVAVAFAIQVRDWQLPWSLGREIETMMRRQWSGIIVIPGGIVGMLQPLVPNQQTFF